MLAYELFNKPITEEKNGQSGETFYLRDRFKPVYYALLSYREEWEDQYLRRPPEVKETVSQIIEQIDKMSEDYSK